jgi:hypothetical protein
MKSRYFFGFLKNWNQRLFDSEIFRETENWRLLEKKIQMTTKQHWTKPIHIAILQEKLVSYMDLLETF